MARLLADDGALHADRPGDVHAQQRHGAGEVHVAPLEPGDEEGDKSAADQLPARVCDVDLLLEDRVVLADHTEEVAEVVGDKSVAGPLGEETEHL